MLLDDLNVERLLHGVVARLSRNNGLHEDLMQEARVHLWQLEQRRPGQTQAWYLQACRYHIQNYLRLGRSIDSTKHLKVNRFRKVDGDESDELLTKLDTNCAPWQEINANDVISVLSQQLDAKGQQVLLCLADGLSAREIARRLKVSHTWVVKCRRKIAVLAIGLGILPIGRQAPGSYSSSIRNHDGTRSRSAVQRPCAEPRFLRGRSKLSRRAG